MLYLQLYYLFLSSIESLQNLTNFEPCANTLFLLVLQSASALEFVKKDLAEFTNTVQEDTTRVAANVKCKLTVSITHINCIAVKLYNQSFYVMNDIFITLVKQILVIALT